MTIRHHEAAVFAALHPDRVRGLVLRATPMHFGPKVGIFAPMVGELDLGKLPESIPGSFLSAASFQASPGTFGWDRSMDLLRSLREPAALRSHLQVERWTLDEAAWPRRLFTELAAFLAREDLFMRGTLRIGGRRAALARITAPLLCVVDPNCRIVPPASVQPFFGAAGSADKTLLYYDGDGEFRCSTSACWSAGTRMAGCGRRSCAGSRPDRRPRNGAARATPSNAATAR